MRQRRALVPLLTALLAVGLSAGPTRAQTDIKQRQDELRGQILEAVADEAAAIEELRAIRDRRAPIDAKVAELDGQIRGQEAKLIPLEAEIADLERALVDAQERLDARQAEYEAARAEVEASAALIYRSARRGAAYDYVAATRPRDLVQRAKYLDQVNERQRGMVQKATRLRDDVQRERKSIESKRDGVEEAAAEVRKARDQIAALRAEIEPARSEAAAAEAAEQRHLADVQRRKAAWEAEWAELKAISDAIAARLRNRGSGDGAAGSCEFRPVRGPIVSGFGTRTNPIGGGTGFHAGIDIAAGSGTPIHACRSGTVVIASWQGGYGNTVVVDHGGGMATLYAHQSSIGVSAGAHVLAGDVIGAVGSTGNSTGPHLHFEVRRSGNPVDPLGYLGS